VMVPLLEADPATAGPARSFLRAPDGGRPEGLARAARPGDLSAERRAFADIDRSTWDRLAALNPWATPFSAWAFHRAWWEGYGESAHEQTLVVVDPAGELIAIVPLMHRHVVEQADAETHTTIRHGGGFQLTPVEPTAKAVYFGASYHADYATILTDPLDLPAVADAVAEALGAEGHQDPDHPAEWDVVDLRRLRQADPTADALAAAFGRREMHEGWTLNVEREDVCPVATLPLGADIDGYLATLGKKERHEIRRKVRRADSQGGIRFVESADPLAPTAGPGARSADTLVPSSGPGGQRGRSDLDAFIDLHQARWGANGLFPETPGGAQSRVFFRRMFEEFGRPAEGSPLRLSFLWLGDRRVAASVHFETEDSIFYYNAGIDPAAFDFSPGVVLVDCLVRRALETDRTRLDFLRGNEPYKYEWGAADEPIQRLLVRRAVAS
jgi:CelD/BcsL family acetyltransferase involved in cellulose biosynthesis